jgi:hypothetical protein
MVNPVKVREKLPNLLVDGSTGNPANWQTLLKKDYRIKKYAQRKPDNFTVDFNNIVTGLERLNRNAESAFQEFKHSRRVS